ncbi:MAG: response regulator, partial [Deltaproteobacteria bacterium]|nr:response regulator [Deltaproteobacteria bacterium]
PIPKGWESVLFIDDEIDIVASMKFRLGQFGYRITGYTDPGEALLHLRRNPGKYNLIITDRVMPVMTGEKVAAIVSHLVPKIPVIVCSGNNEGLACNDIQKWGVQLIVNKPYTPLDLGWAIRRVMEQVGKSTFPAQNSDGNSAQQAENISGLGKVAGSVN